MFFSCKMFSHSSLTLIFQDGIHRYKGPVGIVFHLRPKAGFSSPSSAKTGSVAGQALIKGQKIIFTKGHKKWYQFLHCFQFF